MKITKEYLRQIIKEEMNQVNHRDIVAMINPEVVMDFITYEIRNILDGSIELPRRIRLVYRQLEDLKNSLEVSVPYFSKNGKGIPDKVLKKEINKIENILINDEDRDLQNTRNAIRELEDMLLQASKQ